MIIIRRQGNDVGQKIMDWPFVGWADFGLDWQANGLCQKGRSSRSPVRDRPGVAGPAGVGRTVACVGRTAVCCRTAHRSAPKPPLAMALRPPPWRPGRWGLLRGHGAAQGDKNRKVARKRKRLPLAERHKRARRPANLLARRLLLDAMRLSRLAGCPS